jgi:hypothetical protein
MSAPPSAQSKMSKFSDETLFYIFYAMPQDVLQDAAAYELYVPSFMKTYAEHDGTGDITKEFKCGSRNLKTLQSQEVMIHSNKENSSSGTSTCGRKQRYQPPGMY